MTIYLLQFLNDPEYLCATKCTFRFWNFHSVAKHFTHFMKCLTIKLLFTSQNKICLEEIIKSRCSMYKIFNK